MITEDSSVIDDKLNYAILLPKANLSNFLKTYPKTHTDLHYDHLAYFVPSIIADCPSDESKAIILLRDFDLVMNYRLLHEKSNKIAENFSTHII